MNCFFDIKIDSQKAFDYNGNLDFLIARAQISDDDKLLSEKIYRLDKQTKNYSNLIDEIKRGYSKDSSKKTTAYIVAGNIGSGKSTLIHILSLYGFIEADTSIILEDIYKKVFFDWVNDLKKSYCYAKTFVGEQIKKAINNRSNLLLELVPSSSEKLGLIKALKEVGYKIVVYYLETTDVSVNRRRVLKRYNDGGDFVNENKVLSRNKLVFKYYPCLISLSDELYFLESLDNEIKLLHYTMNGETIYITTN